MEYRLKTFKELTKEELYELLRLRAEVFVVEQDCVYQDIDNKDHKAIHLLGYKDNELIAYTRVFKPGDYFSNASIGRVVVKESHRRSKLGNELMKATIKAVETKFNTTIIEISAQKYLLNFYSQLGFKAVGKPYLEDGIPHIRMIKN